MQFKSKVRTCLFVPGCALDAARYFLDLVPGSALETEITPQTGGPALVAEFTLAGAPFMTLSRGDRDFAGSPLVSVSILTADQDETDRLWNRLVGDGGTESRCGWLQDRYGIYWQIVPEALPRLMSSSDGAGAARVQAALMDMTRIDIAALEAAFAG